MNFCSVWLGSKLLCSLLSLVLSNLNEQLLLQGFDTYTGIIFREWVRDSGVTIHTLLRGLIEVLKEKYLSLIKGMVEFVEINKSVCEWGGMGCSNGCSLRPCTQMEMFYIPCWGGFVLYVCTMIPGTASSRRLGMSLALWHLASPLHDQWSWCAQPVLTCLSHQWTLLADALSVMLRVNSDCSTQELLQSFSGFCTPPHCMHFGVQRVLWSDKQLA